VGADTCSGVVVGMVVSIKAIWVCISTSERVGLTLSPAGGVLEGSTHPLRMKVTSRMTDMVQRFMDVLLVIFFQDGFCKE
jgi:hypothetical protein